MSTRTKRTLLQSDSLNILQAELETAIGQTIVGRRVVGDTPITIKNTVMEIPIHPGFTYFIDTLVLARQIDGSNGTIGDSGTWRFHGSFKVVGSTLTQIGTTTAVSSHTDVANWSSYYDIDDTGKVVAVQADLTSVTAEANKVILFNIYSFIHTLSGGA